MQKPPFKPFQVERRGSQGGHMGKRTFWTIDIDNIRKMAKMDKIMMKKFEKRAKTPPFVSIVG